MGLQLLFEAAGQASALSHEPLGLKKTLCFTLVRGATEIRAEKRRFLEANFDIKRFDQL